MAITLTRKPHSSSNEHIEIFLILLAIFCQIFSCIGLHFITNTYGVVDRSSITIITNAFLVICFMLSFVGKISGAYFFGKFTGQSHFFTVIRLVALGHVLIAIFMLTIYTSGKDFYGSYTCFYFTRFLHSCLTFATIILPAVYLFERRPASQHILIGTYIILAKYAAKFFSRILVHYVPFSQIKILYFLSIVLPCLSFTIYSYMAKHYPTVTSKPKVLKKHPAPLKDKVFCVFIGSVWNIGLHYYSSFILLYLKNVYVTETYIVIDEKFTVYLAYLPSLYLAAKICEKLGAFKTLVFSLFALLVLGFLIPLMAAFNISYMLPQIFFFFFSACLFPPILAFLGQFYKSTKSIFDTIFWFVLGSSISKLFMSFGSRLGFSHYFPLTGMWIFIAITLVCLTGILKFSTTDSMFYRKIRN